MQNVKVALIQQAFKANKAEMLKQTEERIKEVAQNNAELVLLQELHMQYIVSLLRIIWKILKRTSMMISMITLKMRTKKKSK